jgi:hypothetical protein
VRSQRHMLCTEIVCCLGLHMLVWSAVWCCWYCCCAPAQQTLVIPHQVLGGCRCMLGMCTIPAGCCKHVLQLTCHCLMRSRTHPHSRGNHHTWPPPLLLLPLLLAAPRPGQAAAATAVCLPCQACLAAQPLPPSTLT